MKVVRLSFKEKGEEYYFSSFAAIHEHFTENDTGIGKNSIWYKMRKYGFYENEKIRITSFPLISKKRR